jgi:hypothetical protein
MTYASLLVNLESGCSNSQLPLRANEDETKHPVKFRLRVSRRMSRGRAGTQGGQP